MSLLSFNVDGLFITDEEKELLKDYIEKVKPKYILVLNSLPFAVELKKKYSWLNVVYRDMSLIENDNVHRYLTPQTWRNLYASAIHNGLIAHTTNEPNYSERSYIDFEVQVGLMAVRENFQVVVGNYSTGTPQRSSDIHTILELASDYQRNIILGLHEYAATDWHLDWGGNKNPFSWDKVPSKYGWIIGRYNYINDYSRKRFNKLPRILLTEFGYDTIQSHSHLQKFFPGYTDRMGVTPSSQAFSVWAKQFGVASWEEYAYKSIEAMWRNIYKDTNIEGMMLFCFGGQGVWRDNYNFAKHRSLISLLTNNPMKNGVAAMNEGKEFYTASLVSNSTHNIRTAPTTSSRIQGQIKFGDMFVVIEDSFASANGYSWKRVFTNVSGVFKEGWLALVDGMELKRQSGSDAKSFAEQLSSAKVSIETAETIIEKIMADLLNNGY